MKIFSLVSLVIAFNTGAQICFKLAANAASDGFFHLELLFSSALVFLGLSFVIWSYALRLRPISFMHPFLSFIFLTVPLTCQIVFNETLSLKYYLGIIMIIVGTWITSRSIMVKKNIELT